MIKTVFLFCAVALLAALPMKAQSAGTIRGSVLDPSGAAIKGATVQIQNPVSRYNQSTRTDDQGNFVFANIPYNPYHVSAVAPGFESAEQDADVRGLIERMEAVIQPGQSVTVRGTTLKTALGTVVDVTAIGASPDQLTDLAARPRHARPG